LGERRAFNSVVSGSIPDSGLKFLTFFGIFVFLVFVRLCKKDKENNTGTMSRAWNFFRFSPVYGALIGGGLGSSSALRRINSEMRNEENHFLNDKETTHEYKVQRSVFTILEKTIGGAAGGATFGLLLTLIIA
jgi:hypothetical protein